MPPATLKQKSEDDCRLEQYGGKGKQYLGAILLPCGRFPKANFTAFGQCGFPDLPALELPCIEYWFYGLALGDRNVGHALAVEDTQSQSRQLGAQQHGTDDTSTDAAKSDIGFRIHHNGTIGRFSEGHHRVARIVVHPRAVDINVRVSDYRSLR